MKKIAAAGIIILLLITAVYAFAASYGSTESVIICSSMEEFRGNALQEQLNEKFPDKNIIVTYMPTGKAASKVFAEGSDTEIDMLVGLGTGYLSKIEDSLADVSELSTIPYLDEFTTEKNNNLWVTWEKFAGAIIVNTEILDKYGLKAPKDYDDLLKPEYKGLVAMPDPKSSGTGYFFYKSWVNSMGEEAALDYIDKLYVNVKAFTESGSGPIKMLKQGEIAVGLGMTFQAVTEINNGQPFEIIFPQTGSPYSLTGTAMLKGRETNPEIIEIFKFIINDFIVYDKENYSPDTIYENQINKIPNYPQNVTYADMTGIQDSAERERLLSLWKY
ncbi:MAG TPA: extracellular solute-binding protein [Methanocorpusculum sp.]|nr:extracellular solute-binding protein [Methanocorpusculum sp.]